MSGRASASIMAHIGITIRQTLRSAVASAFFRSAGSCLTRENAGIDTLLITPPSKPYGQDATVKASI